MGGQGFSSRAGFVARKCVLSATSTMAPALFENVPPVGEGQIVLVRTRSYQPQLLILNDDHEPVVVYRYDIRATNATAVNALSWLVVNATCTSIPNPMEYPIPIPILPNPIPWNPIITHTIINSHALFAFIHSFIPWHAQPNPHSVFVGKLASRGHATSFYHESHNLPKPFKIQSIKSGIQYNFTYFIRVEKERFCLQRRIWCL